MEVIECRSLFMLASAEGVFVTRQLDLAVLVRNGWRPRFAAGDQFVQEVDGPEHPSALFSFDIGELFAGLLRQLEILRNPDGQADLQPS